MLRYSRLFPIFCIALIFCSPLVNGQAHDSSALTSDEVTNSIPEAVYPGSPAEQQWWASLRKAELDVRYMAMARTASADKFFIDPESPPEGQVTPEVKPDPKRWENPAASARGRFIALIQEGIAKSYHPLIPDRPPTFISPPRPLYSPEARALKLQGTVILSVEFRANGTIGDIEVVTGLGHGLDESAVATASKLIFLPAIKGGEFATMRTKVEIQFAMI